MDMTLWDLSQSSWGDGVGEKRTRGRTGGKGDGRLRNQDIFT